MRFQGATHHTPYPQAAKWQNTQINLGATVLPDHFLKVRKQVRTPFSYVHITDPFLLNSQEEHTVFAPQAELGLLHKMAHGKNSICVAHWAKWEAVPK